MIRYRLDAELGALVEDPEGEYVTYKDYLADEGNWVPFEDYKLVSEQLRELLNSLRPK